MFCRPSYVKFKFRVDQVLLVQVFHSACRQWFINQKTGLLRNNDKNEGDVPKVNKIINVNLFPSAVKMCQQLGI